MDSKNIVIVKKNGEKTQVFYTDNKIIRIARDEAMRGGESLETLAKIQMLEDEDGNFHPVRLWEKGEELETALKFLMQDGDKWLFFETYEEAKGFAEDV